VPILNREATWFPQKDLFESSIMISTMAVRTVYVDVFNLETMPIFPVLEIPESVGCFRFKVVSYHWIGYPVANGCLHFRRAAPNKSWDNVLHEVSRFDYLFQHY